MAGGPGVCAGALLERSPRAGVLVLAWCRTPASSIVKAIAYMKSLMSLANRCKQGLLSGARSWASDCTGYLGPSP